MYIFEQSGDRKINVYGMRPDETKIKEYKSEQLETIDKDKRIYGIQTNIKENIINVHNGMSENGLRNPVDIAIDDINFANSGAFTYSYHLLAPNYVPNFSQFTNEKYIANILSRYKNANNFDTQLLRVFDYSGDGKLSFEHYFMLMNPTYEESRSVFSKIRIMRDMVSITKSLYLFELLNQGHFALIDEDVSEQLNLFKISEVGSLHQDVLNSLDEKGISKNSWEKALENVETSKKVLRYINK